MKKKFNYIYDNEDIRYELLGFLSVINLIVLVLCELN